MAGALQVLEIEEEAPVSAVHPDVLIRGNDVIRIGRRRAAAAQCLDLAPAISRENSSASSTPCRGSVKPADSFAAIALPIAILRPMLRAIGAMGCSAADAASSK